MMVGGSGAGIDHNGIQSNLNLHSMQRPLMEADNADSRKRPLETPVEEAGCTKRTNIGGKTKIFDAECEKTRSEKVSCTHCAVFCRDQTLPVKF